MRPAQPPFCTSLLRPLFTILQPYWPLSCSHPRTFAHAVLSWDLCMAFPVTMSRRPPSCPIPNTLYLSFLHPDGLCQPRGATQCTDGGLDFPASVSFWLSMPLPLYLHHGANDSPNTLTCSRIVKYPESPWHVRRHCVRVGYYE